MTRGLSHRIAVVGPCPIGSALAGHLILAIPNAAVAPFAEVYRDRLAGAVIIDPSNPFLWRDDPATSRARHESPRTAMRLAKLSLAVVTAAMVALAAPARADPDADFAN